jgi:hypothetical protein
MNYFKKISLLWSTNLGMPVLKDTGHQEVREDGRHNLEEMQA